MNKIKFFVSVLVLIFSIVLLTACGTGDKKDEVKNENKNGGENVDLHVDGKNSGIWQGEIATSLIEKQNGDYQFVLKNHKETTITFEFANGQRYDYEVKTKDGKTVYLFSSVASFIQALGNEELKPGEELVYDIQLSHLELEKGEYILEVWLTHKGDKKYKVMMEHLEK